MLPRTHRLRRPHDFRGAVRTGARAGAATLVAHVMTSSSPGPEPVRIGFIVSKSVGTAVARNRVKRRLRHLCAGRLDQLGPGTTLVVRALPPAATADHAQLEADLDSALERARHRSGPRPTVVGP